MTSRCGDEEAGDRIRGGSHGAKAVSAAGVGLLPDCRIVDHNSGIPMKNRLRALRAEREWTQAILARELHVSRQTVNAIETGKYDPGLPLAFRIARLFDMAIEEIFESDDSDETST